MSAISNFNPRSREGSDLEAELGISIWAISIHAPARGATVVPETCQKLERISIHAPARGATTAYLWKARQIKFQSTLPRGERLVDGF